MILQDITDIESSICTDPVSNHSSQAYFIFTMTLMMKWTLAGGKGGGGWGGTERVWKQREAWGFCISEGQECFLMPLGYFSSGSEFPSRAVAPDSLWNLNWLYCGLHLYCSIPLTTSVAFQWNTGQGWEGGRAADMKCWNNSRTTNKRHTLKQLNQRSLYVFLFEVTLHASKWAIHHAHCLLQEASEETNLLHLFLNLITTHVSSRVAVTKETLDFKIRGISEKSCL